MDYERMNLDKMEAIAGKCSMCPEADGLVVLNATPDIIKKIHACADMPVEIKDYPQSISQWLSMAQARYPFRYFKIVSRFAWEKIQEVYYNTKHRVDSLWLDEEDRLPINIHSDFGFAVAAHLEGTLTIGSEDGKTYCVDNDFWIKCTRDLHIQKRI